MIKIEHPRSLAAGVVISAIAIAATALFLGLFDPHPRLALDTFNRAYGTEDTRLDSCDVCHSSRRELNSYGLDVKGQLSEAMKGKLQSEEEEMAVLTEMLRSTETMDSDGDGHSNIAEIGARTFPGDPSSKPQGN